MSSNKNTWIGGLVVLLLAASGLSAPRKVHITGQRAFQLLSLLASGSEALKDTLTRQQTVVVHDLRILVAATHKYDTDSAPYKLAIYSAQGKIGNAEKFSTIGEATALFKFMTDAGFKNNDIAMEGAWLEMQTVECRVDGKAAFTDNKRFECDLSGE
jgi:hypothetical protein